MSQHSHSPTDVPKDVPLDQTPILMPEDNGCYTCDICGQSICIGDGGNKNFLQHCGSPGCLWAARKATASKASNANTGKITSFFSKAKGGDPKPTVSMTVFVARAPFSPPLLPHSSLNPLDQAGNKTAQSASNQPDEQHGTHIRGGHRVESR